MSIERGSERRSEGPAPRPLRIGLVGTYPPRMCGLATFTADVAGSLTDAGHHVVVAALVDADESVSGSVAHRVVRSNVASCRAAAAALSVETDVVLLQHEFGIYGGADGSLVGELTARLTVPYALTLHTVVERFTPGQHAALAGPLACAAAVMVFSSEAAALLAAQFEGVLARCHVVPHGAPPELYAGDGSRLRPRLGIDDRAKVVSTFGLLSPGKGVEHAIRAMPALVADLDDVVLVVAGRTHPAVVRRHGERYRRDLVALAADLGVTHAVVFEDWFHDVGEIASLLRGSDLFATSYTGAEQIVSGALSFAIAAGLPFVSTPYRYAVAMEAAGCGVTVPFADAPRLATALRDLLVDDVRRGALAERARRLGRTMSWPAVGRQVGALLDRVVVDHASDVGERVDVAGA